MQVEESVASALLIGNQASGGFVAENRAGKRMQLSANESSPVEWTAEAKKHYRVVVGAVGDGRYLHCWHGREGNAADSKKSLSRWSTAESLLKLPVVSDESYTLTLKLSVPKAAVSPDAGLYLDSNRVAAFASGATTLTTELPPSRAGQITLKVVCAGWTPSRLNPASKDDRTLGVQLSEIMMRAKNGGTRVFQTNTGEWQ